MRKTSINTEQKDQNNDPQSPKNITVTPQNRNDSIPTNKSVKFKINTSSNYKIKLGTTLFSFDKTRSSFWGNTKYSTSFNRTQYTLEKSQSRSPKRPILPTKRRGNGIPNELMERFSYLRSFFTDPKFLSYYKQTPARQKSELDKVAKYICSYSGAKGEIETFAMIYFYICNQINYDLKGNENGKNNRVDQNPEVVFKSGLALSEGFVRLFEYFCNKIHLKYRTIQGYCKLFPKNPKSKNGINHTWNAIYYRGEWYFVDLTLGSGGLIEKKINNDSAPRNSHAYNNSNYFNNNNSNEGETKIQNEDYFNPYYFLTFPEYLIITHFPEKEEWQMTEKLLLEQKFMNKKFIDLGAFYQKAYQYNIELLTHNYPYIPIYNFNLNIKIEIKNMFVSCDLYHLNGKDKISEIKTSSEGEGEKRIISIEPTFPSHGEFILRIVGRSVTSTDLVYEKLLDYRIKITDETKLRFNRFKIFKKKPGNNRFINQTNISLTIPKYKKGSTQGRVYTSYPTKREKITPILDDEGVYLYEPKTLVLKKGNEYTFKIKVKGALVVAVLDGKKFSYLKRIDENLYEGTTTINSDYVSICSLKSCNVYTEVYRFKPPKEKSSLNILTQG